MVKDEKPDKPEVKQQNKPLDKGLVVKVKKSRAYKPKAQQKEPSTKGLERELKKEFNDDIEFKHSLNDGAIDILCLPVSENKAPLLKEEIQKSKFMSNYISKKMTGQIIQHVNEDTAFIGMYLYKLYKLT